MNIVVSVAKKNMTPFIINPEIFENKEFDGLQYERNPPELNEFIKVSGTRTGCFGK